MLYCMLVCTDGWYGVNCNQQCSGHCRDDTTCNHVTGQCEKGCDKGWSGSLCDKGNLLKKTLSKNNSPIKPRLDTNKQ